MMAASLKDADELVDLLLARDADINIKSKLHPPPTHCNHHNQSI